MGTLKEAQLAAEVVRDAGGRIIGRTRLQKVAFVLEAAGLGAGFAFKYKHYGPYSEELSSAIGIARILSLVQEVRQPASWGGSYSIYTTAASFHPNVPAARCRIAQEAAQADAVELELAATALFLSREGVARPWEETARRKPDKADGGRVERAKRLYDRLRQIEVPHPLPTLSA